ncbi:hypothetical protein HELRODRAFT_69872 [Helobdella robusta]|uniref:Cytochrome P450 n=1 Tax=Helobdella robusta TaxID=6412 RepID=T1FZZ1_HELRO|nr:hypothetical protein HELRODRAFT_69872 [Helobdella robusta]ESN92768.1 hypothetical protein HELRODRAFT_69872 [Helobdella robusta]
MTSNRYLTWTFDTFTKLGIKGPTPLPGLGNFWSLYKMGMVKFDIEMIKKYGPVHGVYFGRQPLMTIYDTSILKQIMIKEAHLFPNHFNLQLFAPPLDKILFTLTDEHWKHVRSVVSPIFSSGKMRKMSDKINKCCKTFHKNLKVEADMRRTFDFDSACDAFTMDLIASVGFGVSIDSHNNPNNLFVRMAKKVFQNKLTLGVVLLSPWLLKPLTRLGVPLFENDFIQFFTDVINRTIKEKDDDADDNELDFLQTLINAHQASADGDNLRGNKDLLAQSLSFFLVGFETVSVTLSYLCYNLACYQEHQERLFKEIVQIIGKENPTYDSIKQLTYLDMCLNETLRMFPFATRTDRVASQDVTINGLFIPKGMAVGIPIHFLQNDPDYWPDPHVFNPERFSEDNWKVSIVDPMRFMPFGAGPRNCVGMRLAKMEVKMAVVHLIRNFRFDVSEKTDVSCVVVVDDGGGGGDDDDDENNSLLC